MTKKEEAQLRREQKLQAEKDRIEAMKVFEREISAAQSGSVSTGSLAGHCLICGIDEAGRGPFAGPVVAGAVILDLEDPAKEILYLNDSKKLSEKKREMLYREILEKAVAVGIGYAGARTIDRINILQATYHAMRNAIANLTCVSGLGSEEDSVHDLVRKLILLELPEASRRFQSSESGDAFEDGDGTEASDHPENGSRAESSGHSDAGGRPEPSDHPDTGDRPELFGHPDTGIRPDYILADAVTIPGISIPQKGIVKGDAKSVSIAAGSIIAKVTRDHIMYEYDKQYPVYGFSSNKGYGTAAHIAAIREYGMTEIHRRSFIHI